MTMSTKYNPVIRRIRVRLQVPSYEELNVNLFQQAYQTKCFFPFLSTNLPRVTENMQEVNNATKEPS